MWEKSVSKSEEVYEKRTVASYDLFFIQFVISMQKLQRNEEKDITQNRMGEL